MKVFVTLRYLTSTLMIRTEEMDLPAGSTAGELTRQIIRAEEEARDISFSSASIVTLVNGQIAAPDTPMHDGDEVRILPVAAAG